jgi:Rhodopirellula transposase DDE domain
MTWKGMHPIVDLSPKVYQKAVTLSKKAMREMEARLERHPELPKWDSLIHPASTG